MDTLIIGGGMAYTFMNALGYSIGTSICEGDKVELAKDMMAKAKEKGVKFLLPVDNVVADRVYRADAEHQGRRFRPNPGRLDGSWTSARRPVSCSQTPSRALEPWSGTDRWASPSGMTFANGTIAVAKAVADSGAISIIGGGDSAAAVEKLGFADKMTHISTGGGASLEFLEGKVLPGIACLNDKD